MPPGECEVDGSDNQNSQNKQDNQSEDMEVPDSDDDIIPASPPSANLSRSWCNSRRSKQSITKPSFQEDDTEKASIKVFL